MSVATPPSRPTRPLAQGEPRRARFRTDVEGLRAIAVLLVMIYHAGVSELSGGFIGVDVFFVVSGFVITTQLLREIESTGRVNLIDFYGRRAKRLLPAAGLVLVVTTVAAWLLTSRVQWQVIGQDILAAAAYVVNWQFAARSVDYLAEDVGPSPVLHFWSLAVEEQFYIIWPLVIIGLLLFLGRGARRADPAGASAAPVPQRRHLAAGLLAVIVVPSLVFAITYTWWRPSEAFFITPTRLWELGAGALVALAAGVLSSWRRRTGALLAWAGLLLVLGSAFLVTSSTPWPGIAAMVPVAGTALVIVGGFSSPDAGPARLLGLRPLVWVGGLSYSLYLWHWPLLRFWEWRFGELSLTEGLIIVAASFLPAWLSYRFVESPIRHARSLRESSRYALSVGLNFTAVSLIAGLVLMQVGSIATAGGQPTGVNWSTSGNPSSGSDEDLRTGEDPDDPDSPDGPDGPDSPDGPGGPDEETPQPLEPPTLASAQDEPFFDAVTPDPLLATEDVPAYYDLECDTTVAGPEVRMCEFGDPDGELVVAVVGDSKVGQWMPALESIAADRGWLIRFYSKSACPFSSATTLIDDEPNTSCVNWSQQVLERLTGPEVPDVVITSALRNKAQDPAGGTTQAALVEGFVDYWSQLAEQGTSVVALSDTPQPMEDPTPYECAADRPDEVAQACTWPSDDGIGSEPLAAAAEQVETASYIDMNRWVCPEGTCVAVYRNVLTYRQGSHITATFAEVLAEPLAVELVPLVEQD